MPEDNIQGEGFTIKDRRAFDNKGETRAEGREEKGPERKQRQAEESRKSQEKQDTGQLPEVTFSSFLLSLSSSVLLHLGEIADPQSGEKKEDLPLAKQSIDIISMLKDKTVGNLTEEEQKLMENLLYDLRMRFVKASK